MYTKLLSSLSLNVGVDHLCTPPLKIRPLSFDIKQQSNIFIQQLFEDKKILVNVDLVLILLELSHPSFDVKSVFQYIKAGILHFGNSNQFVACPDGTRSLRESRLR